MGKNIKNNFNDRILQSNNCNILANVSLFQKTDNFNRNILYKKDIPNKWQEQHPARPPRGL